MGTTLITGTSRGLGKELAQRFISDGNLVIGCSRSPSDISEPNYQHHQLDVSNESEVKELFATLKKSKISLDHLICNAGIASMNHFLLTPASTLEAVFQTNVQGTFLFIAEAARMMQRQKFGRIVTFSTVAVPFNLEGEATYVASKAAVEALTKVLARELAPFNITINCIGPTPLSVGLTRNIAEEKLAKLVDRQGIKRLGTCDDVFNVIEFFLRPQSNFVTGQVLYLGGV